MYTIIENYNLLPHNTFRISAFCRKWVEYTSSDALYDLAPLLKGENYVSIGGGSNILFTKDFPGIVLHSNILNLELKFDGENDILIEAGSGITMDNVIERACNAGLWGLENLSGIPGDVGASVVQNIGAYGVEIKDVIEQVEVFDLLENKIVYFDKCQCRFGYRDSVFKKEKGRYIVTKITYRLKRDGKPVLEYGNLKDRISSNEKISPLLIRETIKDIRNSKLPHVDEIGSAGSFFKNPVITINEFEKLKNEHSTVRIPHYKLDDGNIKIPAAWLIEQCGFKGKNFGNVGVWPNQPLVIVNLNGHATAQQIVELEQNIINTVFSKFGIILSPEVVHI